MSGWFDKVIMSDFVDWINFTDKRSSARLKNRIADIKIGSFTVRGNL